MDACSGEAGSQDGKMVLGSSIEDVISCKGLRKQYRGRGGTVNAVDGIDLEIRRGECFGLLGPNGAGKTTTIEIFEGLLPPTSGTVEVLGRQWGKHDNELRQRIGISLQETRFAERLTVLETLTLFRSFYHKGVEPAEVMDSVGLSEKARSWVGKLSGGQRQRLAVASALVGDPLLLFLDEPTTGLDPQSRRHLWDIIRKMQERERTVLLTTHYMDEAERLCNRVAVIDHGKIIALGSPSELIAGLGGEHIVEFSLANGTVAANDGLVALPAVREVREDVNGIALTVTEPHVAIPALLQYLQSCRLHLSRLATRQASLEDVFVRLTGRYLRDDEISSL
jgi:ABC-2 type transport system ATP-binding protein